MDWIKKITEPSSHLSKYYPTYFIKIVSLDNMILKSKIFETTFDQRIPKNINWKLIFGESWSSRTEFWKVAVPKNFGKFPGKRPWKSFCSNFAGPYATILRQKGYQQRWFSELLLSRSPAAYLELCRNISMMELFSANFATKCVISKEL